ncbi:hypothetical protein [Tepidibacillus marianensis]|uniref:hypothetical protein n=1 Tax=Tepidibacillus marianensis TaxID=3131995 RepID=UPI0030D58BE6
MRVFLLGGLFNTLRDFLLLFLLLYLGEWIAELWGLSRFERAWFLTILTIGLLTFVLWSPLGRNLLWI